MHPFINRYGRVSTALYGLITEGEEAHQPPRAGHHSHWTPTTVAEAPLPHPTVRVVAITDHRSPIVMRKARA